MRISYDPEVDALFVQLRDAPAAEGIDIEDGVTVAVDEAGHIVGLEVLDARQRLGVDALDSVTVERLTGEPTQLGS